jgi:ATP-dependent Clp protease adaptor protein ClpS
MAELVLYNDKENSYMKVKACLIRYCEHLPIQADQCTLIAHNNGRCTIKEGDFMELFEIKSQLEQHRLKVELIS